MGNAAAVKREKCTCMACSCKTPGCKCRDACPKCGAQCKRSKSSLSTLQSTSKHAEKWRSQVKDHGMCSLPWELGEPHLSSKKPVERQKEHGKDNGSLPTLLASIRNAERQKGKGKEDSLPTLLTVNKHGERQKPLGNDGGPLPNWLCSCKEQGQRRKEKRER